MAGWRGGVPSTTALGFPRSRWCRGRLLPPDAAPDRRDRLPRRVWRPRHRLLSCPQEAGETLVLSPAGRNTCPQPHRSLPHSPARGALGKAASPYQGEYFVGVGVLALASRSFLRLLSHLHGRQHGHGRSLLPAVGRPYPIDTVLMALPRRLLPVALHGPHSSALRPPPRLLIAWQPDPAPPGSAAAGGPCSPRWPPRWPRPSRGSGLFPHTLPPSFPACPFVCLPRPAPFLQVRAGRGHSTLRDRDAGPGARGGAAAVRRDITPLQNSGRGRAPGRVYQGARRNFPLPDPRRGKRAEAVARPSPKAPGGPGGGTGVRGGGRCRCRRPHAASPRCVSATPALLTAAGLAGCRAPPQAEGASLRACQASPLTPTETRTRGTGPARYPHNRSRSSAGGFSALLGDISRRLG